MEKENLSEETNPEEMYRTDLRVDDKNTYKNTDNGIYVTLCIFSVERISLALLMRKDADYRLLRTIVRFLKFLSYIYLFILNMLEYETAT